VAGPDVPWWFRLAARVRGPANLVGLLALLVSVARLQLGFTRGAGLALGFGGVALLASDHRWPSVAAGLPFAFTDAECPAAARSWRRALRREPQSCPEAPAEDHVVRQAPESRRGRLDAEGQPPRRASGAEHPVADTTRTATGTSGAPSEMAGRKRSARSLFVSLA
jgi:hypothetical protein